MYPSVGRERDGSNLQLWPHGVDNERITVVSQFNRLVEMATHDHSWHSVSPVTAEKTCRCISNYYFSTSPLRTAENFHVTTFRGLPEQPALVDVALRADALVRDLVRKVKATGVIDKGRHYKR